MSSSMKTRFAAVKRAFENDGFAVDDLNADASVSATGYVKSGGYLNVDNCLGVKAVHTTATTGNDPLNRKKAYYLEGNPRQLGFLMGLMAEPSISRMSVQYVDRVVPAILGIHRSSGNDALIQYITSELMNRFGKECKKILKKAVPPYLQEEIIGIRDGCRTVNPQTKVTEKDLWSLNFGIDLLFSYMFTGEFFRKKKVPASMLTVPVLCNAFSLHGHGIVEAGKHYFGRDFMFAAAGVFQEVACMVICNPAATDGEEIFPFVSQCAPGFVGSIAAMNSRGVAMGVDVFFSDMCNPEKPGFNSLGLVRDTVQHASDLHAAVERVVDAKRGVAWLYPLADGQTHEACVIEAGYTTSDDAVPEYSAIPRRYKKRIPTRDEFHIYRTRYGTPAPRKGVMVRSQDYRYPEEILTTFSKSLWKKYSRDTDRRLLDNGLDILKGIFLILKTWSFRSFRDFVKKDLPKVIRTIPFSQEYFARTGYITGNLNKAHNCPGPYYFAPQREQDHTLVLVTNHAVIPEMRLTSMGKWIAAITTDRIDDTQWRYDELNNQLLEAIDTARNGGGLITDEKARDLIDFLRPTSDNPKKKCRRYYNPDLDKDPEKIAIEGSVSLFELTGKRVWSRFGYYSDAWVHISLPAYFDYS